MKGKTLELKDVLEVLVEYDIINVQTSMKCFGICDPDKKIIYLDSTRRKGARISTLIHELYHAFMFIKESKKNTEKQAKKVEKVTYKRYKKAKRDEQKN